MQIELCVLVFTWFTTEMFAQNVWGFFLFFVFFLIRLYTPLLWYYKQISSVSDPLTPAYKRTEKSWSVAVHCFSRWVGWTACTFQPFVSHFIVVWLIMKVLQKAGSFCRGPVLLALWKYAKCLSSHFHNWWHDIRTHKSLQGTSVLPKRALFCYLCCKYWCFCVRVILTTLSIFTEPLSLRPAALSFRESSNKNIQNVSADDILYFKSMTFTHKLFYSPCHRQ